MKEPALTPVGAEELRVRPAAAEDCRLLWNWANDPEVRSWAFCSAAIPWEEHVAWFQRKLADPRSTIYILLDGSGRPVGQIRFDQQPDLTAQIDISLAADRRGQGMAHRALRLACRVFRQQFQGVPMTAYIKPGNLPSIRTFEKAGFLVQGTVSVKGQEVVFMKLEGECA